MSVPPGLPELLPTVLELVVKVTLLLGVTWGAAFLLRRSSAAVRHLVWTAGIVGALALPVLAGSSPWRWEVMELPAVASFWAPDEAGPGAATRPLDAAESGTPAPGPAEADVDAGPPVPAGGLGVSAVLLAVWGAGAAATVLGFARGLVALRRIRRRGRPAAGEPLGDRVSGLAHELGLERPPEVVLSDDVGAPLAAGVVEPVIVLPSSAARWPDERLDPILIHELAHVQRRDLVTRLLAHLCCALYWFHPLAWIGARRLGAESERACDDRVLEAGTRPSRYASHLLEIAGCETGRGAPGLAVSMARRSEFEGRLLSILDPDVHRTRGRLRHVAGTALAALLLSGTLAVADARVTSPGTETDDVEGAAAPAAAEVGTTLLDLLSDPDPEVRAAAADAVGDRMDRDAAPHLVRSLTDPSKRVRKEAAVALGRLESPSSVPHLAEAALDDDSRSVRRAAIWALGETESEDAVAVLVRIVRDANSRKLRRDAVRALGETRHPTALDPLRDLVRSPRDRMRWKALEALAELGLPGADAVLVEAMESDDPELRSKAARALSER